jgi:uncharacterized membrane protein YhaH (DUF805 family)
VNPLEAVTSAFNRYFDFRGRSMRSEFWWFAAFQIAFYAVAILLYVNQRGVALSIGLFWLFTFIPALSVGVRRLHDWNRSGWWQLLGLVPFGEFVLLFWWAQRGDPEPNRYGQPPTPR